MPNFWTRLSDLFKGGRGESGGELVGARGYAALEGEAGMTGSTKSSGNLLTRVGDAFSGRSYEKIEAGQQQVLDLIKSISVHLDTQSQRSERMAASLAQLAYSLSSMPEATRLQSDTLRTLVNHVAQGNTKTETLAALLSELQKQHGSQGRVLESLAVNLQGTQSAERQMAASLTGFSEAIDVLGQNARQQTDMIGRLSEVEQKQDARLIELIRKQNSRFNRLFIATLVVAGLSVAGVLATLLILLARK